jgi:hypothetical protein
MSEAFPRTPEEIAEDYFARRGGILRALTDGEATGALLPGRVLHSRAMLQVLLAQRCRCPFRRG